MEDKKIKKVGVTGLNGFLGRHISWLLSTTKDEIEIISIPISSINDEQVLPKLLVGLDVLVHLARIHPNDVSMPEDVYSGNIDLAKKIISALDSIKATPYIIFASSSQITKENPYGRAKKEIGSMLREWGVAHNAHITNLIIPNEFGESGIPGRTSVVSTFCDDLVHNRDSKVSSGVTVSLIHAQAVAASVLGLVRDPQNEDVVLVGRDMEVSELYKKLAEFKSSYSNDIIPDIKDRLDLSLFNDLRWHLFHNGFYPRKIILRTDERGSLFEMIKETTGGQAFASSTKSGVTRGNHFHTRKIERFCVIGGQAEICLREVGRDKIHRFTVSGDEPVFIDMPTFFAHNIKNVGKEDLLTLFWSNELFDQSDPDTYPLIV